MSIIETTDRHLLDLLPCPNWCDGHSGGKHIRHDFDGLHVDHNGRTDRHLARSNPAVFDYWGGAVLIERSDHIGHDGQVELGTTTMFFNVSEIDTADEVEDMAADLLDAAAKMRGEQR